jgi:hypothetical protein
MLYVSQANWIDSGTKQDFLLCFLPHALTRDTAEGASPGHSAWVCIGFVSLHSPMNFLCSLLNTVKVIKSDGMIRARCTGSTEEKINA